jgi:hypothetical protein
MTMLIVSVLGLVLAAGLGVLLLSILVDALSRGSSSEVPNF